MRFGQWIEYNQGNILLQNLCRKWEGGRLVSDLFMFLEKCEKWGGKAFCRSFSKNSTLSISLDQ